MLPIRVLLADDSPVFLELAARILSADPRFVVVGQAVSGHDALEKVALLDPDLVLMDWAMPGMNGLEATRRIKAQPGAPRVVMLTLHDHPEYRRAAKDAGADGFIAKWEFDAQLESLIHTFFVALAEGEGRFAPQPVGVVCQGGDPSGSVTHVLGSCKAVDKKSGVTDPLRANVTLSKWSEEKPCRKRRP